MRIQSLFYTGMVAIPVLFPFVSTWGCTDDAAMESAAELTEPVRVMSAEDIVRLPDGRVALCDDEASTMSDCEHRGFLDPEWSVERILSEYPFFDPEEAAGKIWMSAEKRFMSERMNDSRTAAMWWTPSWLPDLLAERDAFAAELATNVTGAEWRRYATQPGYRDRIGARRVMIDRIQEALRSGDESAMPSCDDIHNVLEESTNCAAYRYIPTDWSVERIIAEYDGFSAADTKQIVHEVRYDAEIHLEWVESSGHYGEWDRGKLHALLRSASREKLFDRARLSASEEGLDKMMSSIPEARPDLGLLVLECRDRCYEIEDYDDSSECYAKCDATDFEDES